MRCHNHTKSFEKTHGSAGINSWDEHCNNFRQSTSDDDGEIGKEGVEVEKEAENVSKGTKNNDEMIALTYIVIFIV